MAKVTTGILGGKAWSSADNRTPLYDLARKKKLPGINSRSTKPEIVSALSKASKKEARAAKKAAAKAGPPPPPPPKLKLVPNEPAAAKPVNATPKPKVKTKRRRKLSQAELFRRQVSKKS